MRAKTQLSVLIPDGESGHAINVLRCLGQIENVRIFVLSSDPKSLARFSKYCYEFISFAEKESSEKRLNTIYDTVKKVKPDVVLPVDILTISLLSVNKEILCQLTSIVPLPRIDEFEIANNKGLLSAWLKNNKIPCPATILFKTDNAKFDEAITSFSFPALLKPAVGSGGSGIKFFENQDALNIFCNERIISGEYVLQSFIHGYDIDCSVLCENGKILAYTIQKEFIEGNIQFRRAAGIDFIDDHKTYNLVQEVVKQFNWTGVAHVDLRYDLQDDQVKLIEINPRYWGSLMGSFCSGVNFPYLACLAGLKRDIIKTDVNPVRYIQGKSTINSMAKMIWFRNREKLKIEYSFKFILRDPMPFIMYHLRSGSIRLDKSLRNLKKKHI
ncbi:MAG TPA: ATP-grasp domain-containing protein [Hanamia sp.]